MYDHGSRPAARPPTMFRSLSPAQLLAISFGGLIAVGTLLLALPFALEPGQSVSLVDAFFTATSAVCVTGLIVVDTPTVFSTFGEIVIMVLIGAGGLGYMTLSTVFAVLIGKRLSLQEQVTLQESLNVDSREGLAAFASSVFRTSLLLELIGTIILAAWWAPAHGLGQATYLALFHAVSAFNNAGFSLFPDNLVRYRGDFVVNMVITGLVILGGLGFFTLRELAQKRSIIQLSMHTRLVLLITGLLLFGGTVGILVLEWGNAKTLGPLGLGEKLMVAWFQATVPRTAGFNTIAIGDMTVPALFLQMVLMFIGASPGGTGGGIKTTTFGVTVLALWSTVRGDNEPVVFKRRIATEVIARAFFISLIAFLTMNMVAGLVLIIERHDLLPTLYETVSAFGTVGLSMGFHDSLVSLTGHFSTAGKLLIVLMMFVGRVGPLTLAIALARGRRHARVRYPEGKVLIG